MNHRDTDFARPDANVAGQTMKSATLGWTRHLLASERRFLYAMSQLAFGRFEFLQIREGELVLDPWPTTVKDVKLGNRGDQNSVTATDFALKQQVAELFEYIRSVESGEIRTLEIRHGLPFSMEIELSGKAISGARRE